MSYCQFYGTTELTQIKCIDENNEVFIQISAEQEEDPVLDTVFLAPTERIVSAKVEIKQESDEPYKVTFILMNFQKL